MHAKKYGTTYFRFEQPVAQKKEKNSALVGVGRFACRDTAEGHGDLVRHVEVTRAGRAGWLGGVVLGEA